MKAAIPHVMKSADKKELEPVTPSSTVTLNPPSATRSRNQRQSRRQHRTGARVACRTVPLETG